MGHGMKRGAFEPIENYHYERNDQAAAEGLSQWALRVATRSLVRTRGYPFFLSLIYRVAGVHPRIAKLVQLALVILLGAGLPGLGFYLWRGPGFCREPGRACTTSGSNSQGARDLYGGAAVCVPVVRVDLSFRVLATFTEVVGWRSRLVFWLVTACL